MTRWTADRMPDLAGKTFVVTGANSGIGFETARALAAKRGTVVLACRNLEKGRTAVEAIRKTIPGATLGLEHLDLGALASVRTFAERFSNAYSRLDALINNAGIMAIPRQTTLDGFEAQIGTNHLGHFALTGLLLARLIVSAPSRIVTVSSLVHAIGSFGAMDADDLRLERGYSKWEAYGRSKLANLLFAYELERRLATRCPAVISVACHPGYAATNLQAVGPQMTGSVFGRAMMAMGNALFAQSAAAGALPTLYAATVAAVRGGDFVGPGGPFKLSGAPTTQASSGASHDAEAAKKLWETSVKLTGVTYSPLLSPAP